MAIHGFRLMSVVLALALSGELPAMAAYNDNLICLGAVNETARISRDQLRQLQQLSPGTRLEVEAYCSLPPMQMSTEREGVVEIQRTLHLFEWDPDNGLIMLWRGNVYVGYDFRLVR